MTVEAQNIDVIMQLLSHLIQFPHISRKLFEKLHSAQIKLDSLRNRIGVFGFVN